MTQCPSLLPSSILLLAISSCPYPRAISKKDFPLSYPSTLAIFSTNFTGSAPGERIKKIGLIGSASLIDSAKHYSNVLPASISTNKLPSGNTLLMKSVKATVILSGLKHLRTSNFLNGIYSSFFHSNGSFTFSGYISLYHSLNLLGASFSRF